MKFTPLIPGKEEEVNYMIQNGDPWEREMDSYSRTFDAASKILEIVIDYKLSLAEFETAINTVRHRAVISLGGQD